MNRLLPGDLVSFKRFVNDLSSLPKVQIISVRVPKNGTHDSTLFNTGAEADRLAEIRQELKATNHKHLYLVLAASEAKAFLMRCDTASYLLSLNPSDLIVHNR